MDITMRLRLGIGFGVLVLIALAVYFFFLRKPSQDEVYVIGQQQADAQAAEQRRLEEGGFGPSPMPEGRYDPWHKASNLVKPATLPLDEQLNELCRRYAGNDDETRAQWRGAISKDEFYRLMAFSKRAAVFAMQEQNVADVNNGLTALAMIERERVDWRDILLSVSLLYHAAAKLTDQPDQLLEEAAALAEPNVSELLIGFSKRPPREKALRESWGYDEIETETGIGFIRRGFTDYDPTYDFKAIALDVFDLIGADAYRPGIEIASSLPETWLSSVDDEALEQALQTVRAGMTISGRLRPEERPIEERQSLTIFIVEVRDSASAQVLLDLSRRKEQRNGVMVGVASDRLFGLIIQRSPIMGIDPYETSSSLIRFSSGIEETFEDYTG